MPEMRHDTSLIAPGTDQLRDQSGCNDGFTFASTAWQTGELAALREPAIHTDPASLLSGKTAGLAVRTGAAACQAFDVRRG